MRELCDESAMTNNILAKDLESLRTQVKDLVRNIAEKRKQLDEDTHKEVAAANEK